MNPDPRYNSCEIPEEPYDEKNEILLKDQEWRPERKSKKKRKTETEKQATTEVTRKKVISELQRRQDRLTQLRDLPTLSWKGLKSEDLQLLQLHSPDALDVARRAADAKSALEYFQSPQDSPQLALMARVESCIVRLGLQGAIEENERWRGD